MTFLSVVAMSTVIATRFDRCVFFRFSRDFGVRFAPLNARRSKSFPPTIRCRLFLSDQIRAYLRAESSGSGFTGRHASPDGGSGRVGGH
jgi:hypothetical protein